MDTQERILDQLIKISKQLDVLIDATGSVKSEVNDVWMVACEIRDVVSEVVKE